jgi:hypothetical protein
MEFLTSGSSTEFIVAHCMLALSWNLMCRVSNCIGIKYSHMTWLEDSLGIYFAVMKNDQGGDRPRDPRHIYANPLQPEVCPILALAIYFLCMPFDSEQLALFPGTGQDARFGLTMQRVFKTPAGTAELERRGLKPDDLGTHSIRKGSATFSVSGSTACPSVAAVARRAGWAMGTIGLIYLRYEGAGDQYVGRTVTGLPTGDPDFAILPPFFIPETAEQKKLLKETISGCFPSMPVALVRAAEFCLASVVWHREWLREHLPRKHRLFTTAPFRNPSMLDRLSAFVFCRPDKTTDPIRSTGVPPHVSILQRMDALLDTMMLVQDNQRELLDRIPQAARDLIVQELEARAAISGTLTRDGMRQLLDDLGLADVLRRTELGSERAPSAASAAAPAQPQGNFLFSWGGLFHRLPEDFTFPSMNVLSAWQLWMCGDPSKQHPPFRKVTVDDFRPHSNQRKRFSDLRFLMRIMEQHVNEANAWIVAGTSPTLLEANAMFTVAFPRLGLFDATSSQRAAQFSLLSVVKLLRKKRAAAATADAAGPAAVVDDSDS